MALTNAEKQARWRERNNALAKIGRQVQNGGGDGYVIADADRKEIQKLLDQLHEEGKASAATAVITIKIERKLAALRLIAKSARMAKVEARAEAKLRNEGRAS
jgi:hypothetical protein